MKEKIVKVLNDWFIEIGEIKETERTICVSLSKYICLTSAEFKKIEEETGKVFFIEYKNGHLLLTWCIK